MSARPHQLLGSVSDEARGPNIAPDSDVNEGRRLESPAGFDGINSLDKLGRGVAPAVVAPGEDGRFVHIDHARKTLLASSSSLYAGGPAQAVGPPPTNKVRASRVLSSLP